MQNIIKTDWRGLADFYWTQFKIDLALQFQYRASMIIWLMGLVIEPIIYLVVWRTVTVSEGGSVAGFTAGNFAAYYIAMMIINHLTFTWIMWEYEYYIRNGTLAAMLLRPIHPIHKDVSSNIAYKLLTSAVLLPIVLALIWLFQPTAEITIGTTLAFIPALLLAAAMRFMTGWTLALAAFWTTRISAINSAYFAAIYFFSGRMAPLELFPNFVQIIAYGLPFRWMLAFPVDLLLGKLTLQETFIGYSAQLFWLVVCLSILNVAWRTGVRQFSAVGS